MNDSAPVPESPADALLIELDLRNTHNKAELFAAFAQALSFPAWFGANWDALADCLSDLSWLPAPGYLLHLLGPSPLPATELETLEDILREAAEYWSAAGTPFSVRWLPTREG